MQQRDIPPEQKKRSSRALNLTAAVLVCAILVGSLALVLRLIPHISSTRTSNQGGSITTTTPTADNEQGKVVASWTQTQIPVLNVRSFSWSPDSRYIVSDTQENIQIREALTSKIKRTLSPGGLFAAWSPDGRYIATGTEILDATTGKLARDPSPSITFTSPTGKSALSATFPLSGGSGTYTLAWSPNSSMLSTANMGGAYGNAVVVWNVNTGKVVYVYTGQSEDIVGSLAWSPDSNYIASASFDGVVKVWNAHTGKLFFQHSNTVRVAGLGWAHASMRLAFLTNDNTIQVWDVAANKKITSYSFSTPSYFGPVWSPDDTKIASASGARVNIWSVTTGASIYTFTRHTGSVAALAWSLNGKYIVSGSINALAPSRTPTPKPGISVLVWIA